MNNSISLSRAAATATATLGACLPARARLGGPACLLASALLGAFASPAAAYTPPLKTGSENTPLNLGGSVGSTHPSSGGGASIVRTIVGLAIVIAVIWGLAWILRQVKAGKEGRDGHSSSEGLTSVAALTLGAGRSVHLVRAGNDYVLLGATEHGVAPIHRYTEEEAREAGLLGLLPDALDRQPRSRGLAGQLVAGAGRALVGAGLVREPESALGDQREHSPVAGRRPDPMRMHQPSTNLIDRLREMTVRR